VASHVVEREEIEAAMSGILPTIIYPSTVQDEQARLGAALDGTDASVRACANLDAATRTSWGLFYATARGFTKEQPGWFGLGSMMDRVEKYEAELLSWQQKLSSTCALGVPLFNPNPPEISQGLQYLAWGVGTVAAAYIVGRVISVIPKATKRE
jgi:hypothetical protein